MTELDDLLQTCAEAARRGGAVLRERLGRHRTIRYKGGIDLVTDADHASEAEVLGYLREHHPEASILSEESGHTGAAAGPLRFIVDPLDGTTNYAHGVPHFAVNVAAEDAEGLAAGVTFDPMRGELFLAARGRGATLDGEPVHVSAATELLRALLCTGFPYDVHESPEIPLQLFAAYMARARGVRRTGSAALDLAYVACGRFDGFWELKLKPWDMAAGIVLVREAGGCAADFLGGDAMLARGEVCAGPPSLQPQLLQVLAEARAQAGAR